MEPTTTRARALHCGCVVVVVYDRAGNQVACEFRECDDCRLKAKGVNGWTWQSKT